MSFTATKSKNGWTIQERGNPANIQIHQSLPVAISEMKRAMGLEKITIEF